MEVNEAIKRKKKLIDLDNWVIKGLQELADADNRKLKQYMENVLIVHVLDGGYSGPLANGKTKSKKTK